MLTDENGDTISVSDGEYEALQQVAITEEAARLDEQELLCDHDASPSLVVTKVLTT